MRCFFELESPKQYIFGTGRSRSTVINIKCCPILLQGLHLAYCFAVLLVQVEDNQSRQVADKSLACVWPCFPHEMGMLEMKLSQQVLPHFP